MRTIKKVLTSFERSAESEGVASHVAGAGADGCETTQVAFSVDTTRVDAWIDTGIVHARRFVARAFGVR
jgi:hypothetical protein